MSSSRKLWTLQPVVGEGHVRATVRVEVDTSSCEDTQESYDPKSAVAIPAQNSRKMAGGLAPGVCQVPRAISGNRRNEFSTAMRVGGGSASFGGRGQTYVVNKQVATPGAGRSCETNCCRVWSTTRRDGGRRRQSKSNRRKRTPEEIKNLEQLAAAAIGLDGESRRRAGGREPFVSANPG